MATEKDYSERKFQDQFVAELQKYRWDAPEELNGNLRHVYVDDLINHWRQELNRINADKLEGVPLSDNEFRQVMAKVGQISNSYEAAKLLAIESATGKIDGIYRDPHPGVTAKQITLTIFKKAEVRGGDSSYRIAREVRTENGNRFDLVLLINGLPLINIELKRTDQTLEHAFGQFKRYYRAGEYTHNFMAFSQMMVISSEIDTCYFATPKSLQDFNLNFVFRWATRENVPVTNYRDVIKHFLMVPMAHQMVADYLIIEEAEHIENQRHMLMRPYQVYALQAIESAALGRDNDGIPHGGFVWHTTGSGKTITSFKTALFLSTRLNFDKVIFLVDRRELDSKTSKQFKAYAAYEPVSVNDTSYTYQLREQLSTAQRGIVVTTTFKLNNLVKELTENDDDSLGQKKFVFIIDEAHRTTMGDMMWNIRHYFKKHSLFFGFTGTPLFDESKYDGKINEKSEVIDTTEKLFGPMLHQYTIDQAIGDRNVLGFHVDYINTGEFEDHNKLREELQEILLEERSDPAQKIERELALWPDAKVELEAYKRSLFRYDDATHIPAVVKRILEGWEYQSQNNKFNAILTASYKDRVLAYYNEFQKQLQNSDFPLNIAMTVSFGNENDPDNIIDHKVIQMMFDDYEKFTGIHFTVGDQRRGEDAYFEDLVSRSTLGGSGRNQRNIDLIIVADQLLTGYDSKWLNTLYVDRQLQLHTLIQAYSRTNRVLDSSKEFGTIINFQFPAITKEKVEQALRLYGSGGSSSRAIVAPYRTEIAKFGQYMDELRRILPDPTRWAHIRHDKEKIENFLNQLRLTSEKMNRIQQYYEFDWSDIEIYVTKHTWLYYVGAGRNLATEDEGTTVAPLPPLFIGRTKLSNTDVIDAAHILRLIGRKVQPKGKVLGLDDESLRIIHEEIQELSNMGDDGEARLIKEFVDTELVTGKVVLGKNFDELYNDWKRTKRQKEIDSFAKKWGVDEKLLHKSWESYSLTQPNDIPYIQELTRSTDLGKAEYKAGEDKLSHTLALNNELATWLAETHAKYGD
ncbi:MAG: type I restriction endonuclease subunit R, EcoR124 family [Saccharofermentanales bacterium]